MHHERVSLFAGFVVQCGLLLGQWVPCDTTELSNALNAYHVKFKAMSELEQHTSIMSYRDVKDARPAETATSTVWKSGTRSRSEHLGMVTLEDDRTRVVIDPEERLIHIAKPGLFERADQAWMRAAILREAIGVKCLRSREGMRYQLTYPKAAQYGQVEVAFDSQGWLRSIVLVWGRPIQLEPELPLSALVTPKVVVAMDPPTKPTKRVIMDPGSAFKRANNELVGVGEFAGFQVFDSRIQ